jgi:hypothetical protein
MTQAPVATKVHQALDVHRDITAQIAFHLILGNFASKFVRVFLGQIRYLLVSRKTGVVTNGLRCSTADAENRSQGDFYMLVIGEINPSDSSHVVLYPMLTFGEFEKTFSAHADARTLARVHALKFPNTT